MKHCIWNLKNNMTKSCHKHFKNICLSTADYLSACNLYQISCLHLWNSRNKSKQIYTYINLYVLKRELWKLGERGAKIYFLINQYQPTQLKKTTLNSLHLDHWVKKNPKISFISLCSWICHKVQLIKRHLNVTYPKPLFLEKLICDNLLKYIFIALFSFLKRLSLVAIRFFYKYLVFKTTENLKYISNSISIFLTKRSFNEESSRTKWDSFFI